jgi:hypothetical protein
MGGQMKQRRQYYEVRFIINYPSGQKYHDSVTVLALSNYGAESLVKWLKSSQNITIASITPTHRFVGDAIYPDHSVLGDY